jgi:hypothetical protein
VTVRTLISVQSNPHHADLRPPIILRRGTSRAPLASPFTMVLKRCVLAAALLAASARAEVQIERIFMPLDASPSSFAIGLPGGVNFCFDPVRGGVNYIWKGGFVDLTPARPGPGKFISAVKLLGPVVYQETGLAPLRRGDPARVPTVEFAGYTLRNDAVEFRYSIDGVLVREEVRSPSDGSSIVRRFQVDGGADAKWWHVTDGKPATELKREPNGTFVLEIPLGKSTP